MADKPEFVDLISEATTQSRRRNMSRMVDLVPTPAKETSRLAHRRTGLNSGGWKTSRRGRSSRGSSRTGAGAAKPATLSVEENQAPEWAPVSFRLHLADTNSPVAVVVPVVIPIVVTVPRAMADPARSVIGPDHPAVAVWVSVIGRRVVEAPMEMSPVVEMRPVVGVAIAAIVKRPIAAAVERWRGAETAAMKTSAVEASTVEAATVEATASAVEPAAAMAATTAVTAANLDHRSIGCDFR